MSESVKEVGCYYILRKKLEEETGKNFPECLEYIEFVDDFGCNKDFDCRCDKDKNNLLHHHCLCGVIIKHVNTFKNKLTDIEFPIGSSCIENLVKDISDYMQNKEGFTEMYNKWVEILRSIKRKYKNCKKCGVDWDKPRCFINGLCRDCRNKKQILDKEKCILPKFKGQPLIKVFKANPSYFKFCIEKQTRQYETFKEYLTYC
jgi:hypothetical protein